MSSFLNVLMDMGFSKERGELGLSKTGNVSVEEAVGWLLSHPEEDGPSTSGSTADEPQSAALDPQSAALVAQSMLCEDCGKTFSNETAVQIHAEKTGHVNFAESSEAKKPLTAEEKDEQRKKLLALLRERKMEREEHEKREQLEVEKRRIKSGKELTEAKKKTEELEMKKLLAERKKEKEETEKARNDVRRLIEEDRKKRQAAAAALKAGKPLDAIPMEPVKNEPFRQPPSDAKTTNIQVRLLDGSTMVEMYGSHETLAAVRLRVLLKLGDMGIDDFNIVQPFPRKEFSEDDYMRPLSDLGLVPSAVLIISKKR